MSNDLWRAALEEIVMAKVEDTVEYAFAITVLDDLAPRLRQAVETAGHTGHTQGRIYARLGEKLKPADEIKRYVPLVETAALRVLRGDR